MKDKPKKSRARSKSASAEPTVDRERLLKAKQFAEVARRSEAPLDALPGADLSKVQVVLWRQAAYWALTAFESVPTEGGLRAAIEGAPSALLERVGAEQCRDQLNTTLSLEPRLNDAAGDRKQIDLLAPLARSLLRLAEASALDAQRKRLEHLARQALSVAAVSAALLAGYYLWLRPSDKVPTALRTTSSSIASCSTAAQCGNAAFHTREQLNPWVMYDLGKPTELRLVEVTNRTDCCYERAIPLVVETSDDQQHWTERARAVRAFMTWSAPLDIEARYVRLRVDRRSILHLESVVLR